MVSLPFTTNLVVLLFLLLLLGLGPTTIPRACAQLDLTQTIQDLSGWPCSDYTWEDCPQVVPEGGYDSAKWYEVTRWSSYDAVDTDTDTGDGQTTSLEGRDAYVWEAFQLFDALENRENARITVMQPFALSLDVWPFGGYPVQRDVVIKAAPSCGGGGGGTAGGDTLGDGGGCTIQCGGLTLFVVTRDGYLDMQGLTLLNGGGRLGGFIFVAPGGRGDFHDVTFRRGFSVGEKAVGGAVMIVNGDRAGGAPHNITFRKCNFTDNTVSDGDGGAAWIKQAGLGWVIFDECTFASNRAERGSGGAVFSLGGRVIFAACNFTAGAATQVHNTRFTRKLSLVYFISPHHRLSRRAKLMFSSKSVKPSCAMKKQN